MNDNPYSVGGAALESDDAPVVPPEVLKQIRNAWVAGAVSGTITLAVVLFSIAGVQILGFSAWEFFDVAFVFALAFGIYKKSRTCAIVMLLYFAVSKVLIISENGLKGGIVLSLVFFYYYCYGIAGTFAYHRLKNKPI